MESGKLNISYSVSRDIDLWRELIAGNKKSLDIIYTNHIDALFAYGWQFKVSKDLVDDCIQELFIDIWVKRERLSEVSSIRYYLLKSLKRRILRASQKSSAKVPTELNEFILDKVSWYTQDKEYSQETLDKLKSSLLELNDVQREIIFLKFYNNLSFNEIEDLLRLNRKQLYNALSKAMIKLRKIFEVLPTTLLIMLSQAF